MSSNDEKVLFSDVLGAMVASIAQARQIADVAAVNIAYQYQRNDLLKGMAVPRLRFKNIEVDIPVLIQQVHKPKRMEFDSVRNVVHNVVEDVKRRSRLAYEKAQFDLESTKDGEDIALDRIKTALGFWREVLTEKSTNILKKQLAEQLNRQVYQFFKISSSGTVESGAHSEPVIRGEFQKAAEISIKRAFFEILAGLVKKSEDELQVDELKSESAYQKITTAAANLAADSCLKSSAIPAELELLVGTEDIKNSGGGPDSITRIRFSLLEEGLEWVEDESGKSRLITE